MTELGPALRLARERRELTQVQVMAMTGINNKTLSGYENGVAEPDLETLAILLRLYQASADQLLLAQYRQMSPELRKGLLYLLDALLIYRGKRDGETGSP